MATTSVPVLSALVDHRLVTVREHGKGGNDCRERGLEATMYQTVRRRRSA